MKLKNDYLGINFFQQQSIRDNVRSQLMSPKMLEPTWGDKEIEERLQSLNYVLSNDKHKIYYITKKVQEHAEYIKEDKVNLGWFRQMKQQSSTYIVSKDEFFRFYVEEGKNIFVLHFYKVQSNFQDIIDFRFDTWVIRFDPNKYPDGFMPENEHLGQKFENKIRFIKLLLFVELSGVMVKTISNNEKVKLDKTWDLRLDYKVKNESGVSVILVDTSWNKTYIRTEGFEVQPHIRIQPYGQNRSLYKPIWIEGFSKKGYIRKASKLRDQDNNLLP